MAIGSKKNEADNILRAATSPGSKASNPFFIKINELPQINDNIMSNAQAKKLELLDFVWIIRLRNIQGQK